MPRRICHSKVTDSALLRRRRKVQSQFPPPIPFTSDEERSSVSVLRSSIRSTITAFLSFAILLAVGVFASTTAVTEVGVRFHDRLSDYRTGWITTVAEIVTDCAQPAVGIAAAVGVSAWLVWKGRRVEAAWALALMAATLVVSTIAKYVIREPRPPQRLWLMSPDTVWSFPSGHTAVAAATVGLAYLLTARTCAVVRWAASCVAALFALAVAASRLYLSVHYPLDVAASFLAALTAVLPLSALWSIPAVENWVRDRLTPDQHTASHR